MSESCSTSAASSCCWQVELEPGVLACDVADEALPGVVQQFADRPDVGAASAVPGILYALTERELKRFLAFTTIENIGIIILAAGAAMTYASYHENTLAAFSAARGALPRGQRGRVQDPAVP